MMSARRLVLDLDSIFGQLSTEELSIKFFEVISPFMNAHLSDAYPTEWHCRRKGESFEDVTEARDLMVFTPDVAWVAH